MLSSAMDIESGTTEFDGFGDGEPTGSDRRHMDLFEYVLTGGACVVLAGCTFSSFWRISAPTHQQQHMRAN